MERRVVIAEAGIRLVAREGVHALTHRRVDTEAGLPAGSTSYYARTRRDLIRMVAARLSDGSTQDVADVAVPEVITTAEAARLVAKVSRGMSNREDAQAARFLLMLEMRHDLELRDLLTPAAAARPQVHDLAGLIMDALGVPRGERDALASQLVVLVDALLMYETSRADTVALESILTSYLNGILK